MSSSITVSSRSEEDQGDIIMYGAPRKCLATPYVGSPVRVV